MLTIKEWMELVDYRITEGDSYGWQCFGSDAYSLSSWNGDQNGWSFNIVFDTKTQTVYTVEVCDYAHSRAYRMINPDYKSDHDQEASQHNVSAKEAWDGCDFIDLEEDDDFIQKSLAIKSGEDYDTRVSVPLTVPDDALFELMKQAHEQDITLNQLVENILREFVDHEKTKAHLSDDEFWDKLAEECLMDDDHFEDQGVWSEMPSDLEDVKTKKKSKKKNK
jgi:hypothetical protein